MNVNPVRYDAAASGPKAQALARPDAKPTAVIGTGVAEAFEPSGVGALEFLAQLRAKNA